MNTFVTTMKRLIFFLLICFCPILIARAQSNQKLSNRLSFYVNNLRDSLGLNSLQTNDTLKLAAEGHSQYMAKHDVLGHEQKSNKTKTPAKRVKLLGGDEFEMIGENVLFTNTKSFPKSNKKIDELAYQMFLIWKTSPGHYANMINPSYTLGDFGFALNEKTQKIYVTQVCGKGRFKVKNQLSKNGFGVEFSEASCDGVYQNFRMNMGNSVEKRGDTIFLNHHSLRQVTTLLKNSNDGIAIDVVRREQFVCNGDHLLDGSPVYDGIMLKPIYYDELLASNSAQGDYRLITPIGIVPEKFKDLEYSISLIFIVNGKACDYKYPVFVPSQAYELIEVEPKIKRDVNLKYDSIGIVASDVVYFDFKTNRTVPLKTSEIIKRDREVTQVSIYSYSSIEGDSARNEKLHNQRAQYMTSYMHKRVRFLDEELKIKAVENWKECYFQMELLGLDSLMLIPKNSIRQYVKVNQDANWDSLLFEQRKAIAIIHYKGNSTDNMFHPNVVDMNLRQAILCDNDDLANKAIAELYDSIYFSMVMFEPEIITALSHNSNLTQNAAAYYSRYFSFSLFDVIKFTGTWLSQSNELDDDAKFNILQLYNVTTDYILDEWDVKSENLAKVLHPSKVKKIVTSFSHNQLLLNYHLSAISYYGQINDGTGINESFNFITSHFKKSALNIEDEIKLCLFFNSWSRYDLTIDFLNKRIDDKDFNETAAFILARTVSAYNKLTIEEENKVYKKAFDFNKSRWCEWITNEFQILRNPTAKQLFCDECQ
jgi:uncharacterized protein YkwD